ncbi:DUF6456 domain-containing protein [Thioclava sp. 'Guangxiensis']|uniref:DUF6456 domain-containing protein n=1 Tax=Thioclava sp. 'Guangxiensis' TaxID=3149044 RepID=UPI003877C62D
MHSDLRHGSIPNWLTTYAKLYLTHVEEGVSIRQLAREEGCHASTILRRIRRIEERREDPLVDQALDHIREGAPVATPEVRDPERPDTPAFLAEARRVLQRLTELGALLIMAPNMEKAVVLRGTVRLLVVDVAQAETFALRGWIAIKHKGRVTSYEITRSGRDALRSLADDTPRGRRRDGPEGVDRKPVVNTSESPLAVLARRRDRDGKLFLEPQLVAAGERLREDFELAQMGPRVTQNWDRFLTAGVSGGFSVQGNLEAGSEAAKLRVGAALQDLGPGLGDIVLRCCCFLEGLETTERDMGWSARSGKIVLRIALIRLHRHYEERYGGKSPLIG